MAVLTVKKVVLAGLDTAALTAADVAGDTFANDAKTFLYLRNVNAATRTVTINSQKDCNQGFDHDAAVIIPVTTGERMIGPFAKARFNDSAGIMSVTYDAVAGLTVDPITLTL